MGAANKHQDVYLGFWATTLHQGDDDTARYQVTHSPWVSRVLGREKPDDVGVRQCERMGSHDPTPPKRQKPSYNFHRHSSVRFRQKALARKVWHAGTGAC
jgi:hypothetical protein